MTPNLRTCAFIVFTLIYPFFCIPSYVMEGEGCNLLGCPKSTTVNVDTVKKNNIISYVATGQACTQVMVFTVHNAVT